MIIATSHAILYVTQPEFVVYGADAGKQLAILVGPTKAMGTAINRVMDRERYTACSDRLKELRSESAVKRTGTKVSVI